MSSTVQKDGSVVNFKFIVIHIVDIRSSTVETVINFWRHALVTTKTTLTHTGGFELEKTLPNNPSALSGLFK